MAEFDAAAARLIDFESSRSVAQVGVIMIIVIYLLDVDERRLHSDRSNF